jgi:hypothetical protein
MKTLRVLMFVLIVLGANAGFAQAPGADAPATNNNRATSRGFYRNITDYMPPAGCDNSGANLGREIGAIERGTKSLAITFDNDFKVGCGVFVYGAGPASTLAAPAQGAAPNPNVIGTPGTATVHYKIASIDEHYGTSAAGPAITVTKAPAVRTPINYVGIYWAGVAHAIGYLVYSDASGSYAPLGYSFDCNGFSAGNTCGIIDKGPETNTWTGFNGFWPITPPEAPTNQALITTIAAKTLTGPKSFNLTLAAPATNSARDTFVFPDNSMFVAAALAAATADGGPQGNHMGTVYIPQGLWFMSTIPFPAGNIAGVKIIQNGAIELFGLPIEGNLGASGATGKISISGEGGTYAQADWTLSCSQIIGFQTLGALFVASGSGSGIDLSHICLSTAQTGIIQDSQGDVTTQDVSFYGIGSGPLLQVDNNAFFSLFDRTNWNDGPNNKNNNIPAIWFLGLTSPAHTSVFDFRDNSFVSHTIRVDIPYPAPSGPTGYLVFDGLTTIEDNHDLGFINLATCNSISFVTFDNVVTGDAMAPSQALVYSSSTCGALPGNIIFAHGQTSGFSALSASSINAGNPGLCRDWTYESPNEGGGGNLSIGYWGSLFGSYSGCDIGITQTGYDVQTTELLVSGGNDPSFGPAGEQMIGHVFRRPFATVDVRNGGSLTAGTYYIKVTVVDVAGRESAPSIEISKKVENGNTLAISATTGIYFPASCNFYFGTSPGKEEKYLNSTVVTDGTCRATLSSGTQAGVMPDRPGTPRPVGNAMRSWLTAENNADSCLFCGLAGGLGKGFLGFNLSAAQYDAPPAGVQFPFNGGVHSYKFYSAAETTRPSGISNVDELYADSSAHQWKKIENNGTAFNVAGTLAATTEKIGGTALAAGKCASGTVSVAGAATNMTVSVSPTTYAGDGFVPWGYVSANGTVTVKVCAQIAGTPGTSSYNVRVIQ